MNLQGWLDQMQALMKALNTGRPRLQDNEHFIGLAPDLKIVREFEREFWLEKSPQLIQFYQTCGGQVPDALNPRNCLQLDRVGPSYALWTSEWLLKTKEAGPLAIKGEHAGSIITIGHSGYEDQIAVRTDGSEKVLLLPESGVEEGVYEETDPVIVIANDFNGFLERMLADTQAALRGDKNWKYMTSWED